MVDNYTYDSLNDPGYYTGDLSTTSIVDQKDTYMAFCAAVGGRNEPEIIKSQKYEITTLIDENGEIYTPNDTDIVSTSIIKNVFGRGKRTEIRVISNPGNANLNYPGYKGTHTSQGVGYFQNILVTTYGTGAGDWAQTMSFANAISQDFVAENLNAKWGTNTGFPANAGVTLSRVTWQSASYMFSRGLTDMPNFQTGGLDSYKLINYSTDTANTRFKVKVKMPFSKRIYRSDSGTYLVADTYPLIQPINIQWRVRNLTTNTVLYTSPYSQVFYPGDGAAYQGVEGESSYFDMNQNDTFQIEWRYNTTLPNSSLFPSIYQIVPFFDLRSSSTECYYQFIPENPAASVVGQITYINGQNSWFAPYIKDVWTITGSIQSTDPDTGDPFGYNAGSSLLFWSPTASANAFSSYPQQLPAASETFGFGGVEVLPFNQIRAGDFIRFGYWKPDLESAVHFIEKKYINGLNFGLLVTPAVTTTGTPLGGLPALVGTGSQYPSGSINNFNIYRIDENNNTSTVNLYINELYPARGPFSYLNPLPGGNGVPPSVILFPENASQKLKDNYNSIIKRLTAEGIVY